jgi:hypothetical protein
MPRQICRRTWREAMALGEAVGRWQAATAARRPVDILVKQLGLAAPGDTRAVERREGQRLEEALAQWQPAAWQAPGLAA